MRAVTHARAGGTDAACDWGRELAQHASGIHSALELHLDQSASVTKVTWTEPATWYANLASFYAAAAAFITDPAGNVLLVKPCRPPSGHPDGFGQRPRPSVHPAPQLTTAL